MYIYIYVHHMASLFWANQSLWVCLWEGARVSVRHGVGTGGGGTGAATFAVPSSLLFVDIPRNCGTGGPGTGFSGRFSTRESTIWFSSYSMVSRPSWRDLGSIGSTGPAWSASFDSATWSEASPWESSNDSPVDVIGCQSWAWRFGICSGTERKIQDDKECYIWWFMHCQYGQQDSQYMI